MILLRLEGGLGNVMFEYALGRYLAHKNNTQLKYDVDTYKTNPLGDYSLSLEAFTINIRNNIATPEEIARLKRFQKIRGKGAFFHNLLFSNEQKYIREKNYPFDPTILTLGEDIYLHGWWQSEKYFLNIRPLLLKDFTLRNPLAEKNKEVAQQIVASNSIGIHIRRLDYVKNKKTRWYHGELPKDYYEEALSRIISQTKNPKLFIFSDDIEWAREHMHFPYETSYIGWNLQLPHEDMHLMSLCKHNITANSSFSWWGAWLNQNPDKIVVAPTPWVALGPPKHDSSDVVPESWIKLPVSYIRS
jgi:hypothetical protein